MTTKAVENLLSYTLDTQFNDFPETAVQAGKVFLFDTLAVAVAGSADKTSSQIIKAAQSWGQANEASILGTAHNLPAPSAAFVNGYHTHCLEWDCVHEQAVLHPMSTLMAALCAYAERQGGLSYEQLLEGIILGVDLAVNIGLAAGGKLKFFRPANAGLFAAAAALAKLEGMDLKQTQDVWGLAYSQMSGTMQAHIEGSIALPLQIGFAARAAITAIDLVKQGFTGPHDVLEGVYGYYTLFEDGGDCSQVLSELGNVWRIEQVSHKPFPTGRAAHGALDGLQRIQREQNIRHDEIQAIALYCPALIERLIGRPYKDGMTANYARLCLPYLASVLLISGSIGAQSCTEDLLENVEVKNLAKKIMVYTDLELSQEEMTPQKIVLTTKSGVDIEQLIEHTLGSPNNPLNDDAQVEKAMSAFKSVFGDAGEKKVESLYDLIFSNKGEQGSVKKLLDVCSSKNQI